MSGMKFEYEGTTYDVPCMPKKEWGEWMTSCAGGCRVPDAERARFCGLKCCPRSRFINCIYTYVTDQDNTKARKAFYYECFPEEKPEEKPSCDECANYKPKEELPKLTQEVFERKDCPEWAKYAAVDESGEAFWYSERPGINRTINMWAYGHNCKQIEGKFDASDWQNSLIEKVSVACEKSSSCANYEPKKQVLSVELPFKSPKLSDKLLELERPEWARWAAVDANGFAYWYDRPPKMDTMRWSLQGSDRFEKIPGSYDASDWRNSLVYVYSDAHFKEEVVPCVPEEVINPELLSWPTKWKYSKRKELYYYKSTYQLSEWRIKYGEPQQVTFWIHDKIPADVVDVKCPLA